MRKGCRKWSSHTHYANNASKTNDYSKKRFHIKILLCNFLKFFYTITKGKKKKNKSPKILIIFLFGPMLIFLEIFDLWNFFLHNKIFQVKERGLRKKRGGWGGKVKQSDKPKGKYSWSVQSAFTTKRDGNGIRCPLHLCWDPKARPPPCPPHRGDLWDQEEGKKNGLNILK